MGVMDVLSYFIFWAVVVLFCAITINAYNNAPSTVITNRPMHALCRLYEQKNENYVAERAKAIDFFGIWLLESDNVKSYDYYGRAQYKFTSPEYNYHPVVVFEALSKLLNDNAISQIRTTKSRGMLQHVLSTALFPDSS